MEKTFAFGISGMFVAVSTGAASVPALFAQSDAVSVLGLAERLGLGAVMAILGYKIILKIIEVFGPPLLARLNAHDAEVQEKLSVITKKVHKIEEHLAPGTELSDGSGEKRTANTPPALSPPPVA